MLFKKKKSQILNYKECIQVRFFQNYDYIIKLTKREAEFYKNNLPNEIEKIIPLVEVDTNIIGKYPLFPINKKNKQREKENKKERNEKKKKKEIEKKEKKIKTYDQISKEFVKKKKKEEEEIEMEKIFSQFNFQTDEKGLCHLPITVGELMKIFQSKKNKINTLSDENYRDRKSFSERKQELFNRIKLLSKKQVEEIANFLNIKDDEGIRSLIIDDIKKKNYSAIRKKVIEYEKINQNIPNFKTYLEEEEELKKQRQEKEKLFNENKMLMEDDPDISMSFSDEDSEI